MAIITVNELIATLAQENTEITDNLISILVKQINEQNINLQHSIDQINATRLLVKLLNRNINFNSDPLGILLVMAAAMENPKQQNLSEKNLITLILQLTKELIKTHPETVKDFYFKLIKNNTSDRPHIKPFMDFVLNYKGEVEPQISTEINEVQHDETHTVSDS